MLYIHIHEYPIYSIGYRYIHISIYNIDIHVTSGHIFSGKYGHTCTEHLYLSDRQLNIIHIIQSVKSTISKDIR